jgi:hypothetical protein
LALFNAHYDSRCFLPIDIYEATTGKPVAIILRPGKTPDGAEVALVLRHVIGRIRARWPAVEIIVRGDSHYGRPEAMAWCERRRIGYIFGLAGNPVLLRQVGPLAEDAALGRLAGGADKVRRYGDSAMPLKAGLSSDASSAASRPGPRGPTPLHRHQPAGPAQDALRQGLLRTRAGREPDQGAQAPPRLRPHLVPQGDRQPIPPAAPHRCLLADAEPAQPGAPKLVLARCPVRHHPPLPDKPFGATANPNHPASPTPPKAAPDLRHHSATPTPS